MELILNSPYLPRSIQQQLIDIQQDWNTLGGSKCSYEKHRVVIEREKKRRCRELLEQQQQQQAGLQKDITTSSSTPLSLEHSEGRTRYYTKAASTIFEQSLHTVELAARRFGSLTLQSSLALESYIENTLQQLKDNLEGIPSSQNIDSSTTSYSTTSDRNTISNYHPHLHQSSFNQPYLKTMAPAQQDDFPSIQTPPSQQQSSTTTPPNHQPLPEAVLVYHESAHSIVFRDHLRRQLTAIRRTTTDMETSLHSTTTAANDPSSLKQGMMMSEKEENRYSSTHSDTGSTIDVSERGYRPSDSSDVGYESTGSRESHGSSLDRSERGRNRKEGMMMGNNDSKTTTVHSVAVANFQPVIEPLEKLELNAMDVFGPLLDADPVNHLEGDGGGDLDLTEAEVEGEEDRVLAKNIIVLFI